ncbi:MAG: hypothetical protein IPP90_21435 [Gemmatimonadaceae bacterium]|nr:hypothetical protein [Gemmatimonadaceae bacterium]
MISSMISRASAVFLALTGLALLFGSDVILPTLIPGDPPAAAWLGQLLAAAWLGVAVLNWYSRSAVLGGIYGRPVVSANATLYFVSALTIVRAATGLAGSRALWLLAVPFALFAGAYGALMFRGPFDSLDVK